MVTVDPVALVSKVYEHIQQPPCNIMSSSLMMLMIMASRVASTQLGAWKLL